MRKQFIQGIMAAGGLLVACDADALPANESAPRYSIEGSVWHSQGTFGFELGDDTVGTWSKVEWPLDGVIGGLEGIALWPLDDRRAFILKARYGQSFSLDGTSRDWDWRPWERPDLSDYSETDSSGSLQTLDLRAGLRFSVAHHVELQLLAGYSRSSLDFEDSNLTGSYDYGQTPVSYEGAVDTYAADLSGFCLGGELIAHTGEKLTLSARAEATVSLSIDTDADWIRQGNQFEQSANGNGMTISGQAGYAIRPHMALTAEAGWTSLSAQDGRQSGTQDGVSYDADIVREISMESATFGIGMKVDF